MARPYTENPESGHSQKQKGPLHERGVERDQRQAGLPLNLNGPNGGPPTRNGFSSSSWGATFGWGPQANALPNLIVPEASRAISVEAHLGGR
jgi:hypothetical protein